MSFSFSHTLLGRPRTRSGSHALSVLFLCFLWPFLFLFLWGFLWVFFPFLFFSFSFFLFSFFVFLPSFFFFLFSFFFFFSFSFFCFWVCFIYKFWPRRLRFPSSCRVSQRLRRPDARFPFMVPGSSLTSSALTSSLAAPTTAMRANPNPSGWGYTPPSFCRCPTA